MVKNTCCSPTPIFWGSQMPTAPAPKDPNTLFWQGKKMRKKKERRRVKEKAKEKEAGEVKWRLFFKLFLGTELY